MWFVQRQVELLNNKKAGLQYLEAESQIKIAQATMKEAALNREFQNLQVSEHDTEVSDAWICRSRCRASPP